MGVLVGLPFAATFSFARPIAAGRRNAGGAIVATPPNVPRYDHDVMGARLGLLVTAGPANGQHDAVSVLPGDWEADGPCTLLWSWAEAGLVYRRALYSTAIRDSVDAALNITGHHVLTGAVPGFLPNLGGFVRYRATDWLLGRAFAASNAATALTDRDGNILIESV